MIVVLCLHHVRFMIITVSERFILTTTYLAENPRSQVNIVNFPSTCVCLTSPLSNFGFVFSGDTVDLRAEKKSNVKESKRAKNV